MTGTILAAVIGMLKARGLAFFQGLKDNPPAILAPFIGALTPALDALAQAFSDWIDSISIAELESELPGRLLELLKTGEGPSASSGVDLS